MTEPPKDTDAPRQQRAQASEAELSELRTLILGKDVQERLKTPKIRSQDVSQVLPEAIILSRGAQEQLTTAVTPTIEDAIKNSVHHDQYVLSEALFPIIGPATRKAVEVALQDFTQTLNQGLDQSLSPRSIKWRFEAWRTGKSFAEIVILHTLIYRVEQIFLIHKNTGLLLQHIVTSSAIAQDPDLVSAMLTAIQDFVRDSFVLNSTDTLDTLHFGELTIWIENGPHAVLAGVVRGNAPPDLRTVFQKNLEKIHLVLGEQLKGFQGDNSPFEASTPYLEDCLQGQFKEKKQTIPPLAFILVPLVLLLSYWAFNNWRDGQQWSTYVERLNNAPGIVVQKNYRHNGKYYLQGMRDPEASDPKDERFFQDLNLDSERIDYRWEPYWSFHPDLIEARAKAMLAPPSTVKLNLNEQHILAATGIAEQDWRNKFLQQGQQIAGVLGTDVQALKSQEAIEIQNVKQEIEGIVLLFSVGEIRLDIDQQENLEKLILRSSRLIELADKINKTAVINIEGSADAIGTDQRNIFLSQARANYIREQLIANAIPPENLKIRGLGALQPKQNPGEAIASDPNKRKVSLIVDIQG